MSSELIQRMLGVSADPVVAKRATARNTRTSMSPEYKRREDTRLESRFRLPTASVRPVLCPFCSSLKDKVIDSRMTKAGDVVRRRRHCLDCGRRFTTYERIYEIPHMVIKKDGRREPFDRQKLLKGILRACEKRPVSTGDMQAIVGTAETLVTDSPDRECPTRKIGELIMAELKRLDRIAYVRFASVYRDFKHVSQFVSEVHQLQFEK